MLGKLDTNCAPLWPNGVDLNFRAPHARSLSRWCWTSVGLVWAGIGLTLAGTAVAIESPIFAAFYFEGVVKEWDIDPSRDFSVSPFRSPPLVIILEAAFYGTGGLLFTSAVAGVVLSRSCLAFLSVGMSVAFCGGCLLVSMYLVQLSICCFRWSFIVWGFGLSAMTLGLCIGGISAAVLECGRERDPGSNSIAARAGRQCAKSAWGAAT